MNRCLLWLFLQTLPLLIIMPSKTLAVLISDDSFFFNFWWRQLAARRSLNCGFAGEVGVNDLCPRNVMAIHSVDRTPNLPTGRRTLNHWAIVAQSVQQSLFSKSKHCKSLTGSARKEWVQTFDGCSSSSNVLQRIHLIHYHGSVTAHVSWLRQRSMFLFIYQCIVFFSRTETVAILYVRDALLAEINTVRHIFVKKIQIPWVEVTAVKFKITNSHLSSRNWNFFRRLSFLNAMVGGEENGFRLTMFDKVNKT